MKGVFQIKVGCEKEKYRKRDGEQKQRAGLKREDEPREGQSMGASF